MSGSGKVLIIDDERSFIEMYQTLLGEQGYPVEAAMDAATARARLADGGYSVVVLDQKLEGSMGRDSGLDLLAEISVLAPGAKVLLATAYASKEAIERAFALGAYDYLEKNPKTFETQLRIKVRNAVEVFRERSLANIGRDPEGLKRELVELWNQASVEGDRQRKGRLLEDLVELLFRNIPGFQVMRPRYADRVQEIDVVVANESADPVWSKEGSIIVVECKNHKERSDAPDLLVFEGKMRRYRQRCTVGFFVAPAGFTKGFAGQRSATSTERPLVVPIDGEGLQSLIMAADRNAALKALFRNAALSLSLAEK